MNLQTQSPRTSAGPRTILFAALAIFSVAAVSRAQQTSSSNANPRQAAPAAARVSTGHLVFEGGAGGNFGAGLQNGQYVNPSFAGLVGAGYKLNRRLTIFVEGNYYHNGMPSPVLQTARQTGGSYNTFTISGDPMLYIYHGAKFGVYAVGGGGFSSVRTSFNGPIGKTINCRIYSGLGYKNFTNFCSGKITGSSYSTTQAMYDFGIGFQGRLYPNRRESLFVESRYVKIMTPANQLPTPNLGLVAITGGVRW